MIGTRTWKTDKVLLDIFTVRHRSDEHDCDLLHTAALVSMNQC